MPEQDGPNTASIELNTGRSLVNEIGRRSTDEILASPSSLKVLDQIGHWAENNGLWKKIAGTPEYDPQGRFNPINWPHDLSALSTDPHLTAPQQLALVVIKEEFGLGGRLSSDKIALLRSIGRDHPNGSLSLDAPPADTNTARIVSVLNANSGIGVTFVQDAKEISAELSADQYANLKLVIGRNPEVAKQFGGQVDFDSSFPINPTTGRHKLVITNADAAMRDPAILQSFTQSAAASKAVLAGEFETHRLPETKEILDRLSKATGLRVELVNAHSGVTTERYGTFKFNIPEGVDRERFVNDFITVRNSLGVSRQGMPIIDGLFGFGTDPKAFYVENDGAFTETSLRKLDSGSAEFHKILPKGHAALPLPPKANRGNQGLLKQMASTDTEHVDFSKPAATAVQTPAVVTAAAHAMPVQKRHTGITLS